MDDHFYRGFFLLDPMTHDLLEINESLRVFLGYSSKAELLSIGLGKIFSGGPGGLFPFEGRGFPDEGSSSFCRSFLKKDGSVVDLQVRYEPLSSARGEVGVCEVWSLGESTGPERYSPVPVNAAKGNGEDNETLFGESAAFYVRLMEMSPYAIFLLDLHTLEVIEANPLFWGMMGYSSRDEVVGSHLNSFLDISSDEVREIISVARTSGGIAPDVPRAYRRKDGSLIRVISRRTIVPINGRDTGMLYLRDITEEVEADALDRLKADLDERVLSAAPIEEMLSLITERLTRVSDAVGVDIVDILADDLPGNLRVRARHSDNASFTEELSCLEASLFIDQGTISMQTWLTGVHRTIVVRNLPAFYPYKSLHEKYGIREVHTFPFHQGGRIVGVIRMAFDRENALMASSVARMERLMYRLSVLFEQASEQEHSRLLTTALATVANGVMITDASGKTVWVNKAMRDLSGYDFSEMIGKTASLFLSPDHHLTFLKNREIAAFSGIPYEGQSIERRKDGSFFPVEETVTPILSSEGTVSHFVHVKKDISTRIEKEQEIWNLANRDSLTGLLNRYSLLERLDREMVLAKRTRSSFAILFMDLDGFKRINDMLGHAVGDQLLQITGMRLKKESRPTDFIARLGGDEFVVVLTGISRISDEIPFLGRILDAISAPVSISGNVLQVTASIGVACAPENAEDVDTLMRKADLAMYQAKSAGRNTWCLFDAGMENAFREDDAQENDLRSALVNGEFRIVFQPQMDMVQQKIVGVESLLRWERPGKGTWLPEAFIPLAEKTGLICSLVEWMLDEVFRTIRRWVHSGALRVRLSLNVSVRQFADPAFWKGLEQRIGETGELARWLTLEIKESLLLENPDLASERIRAIRKLGVRISLDDFGVGYSSLSYLSRLELDEVKISQVFVGRISQHPKDLFLVKGIVSLAKSLGLDLVGEGAETREDVAQLLSFGCTVIQGYFVSRPLNENDLERFIELNTSVPGNGEGPS